jgi:hypothetical protein
LSDRIKITKTTTEKAVEALGLLPEEMREPAVAYLLEQAEKCRLLEETIDAGIEDVAAGRVSEWNFDDFLRAARALKVKQSRNACCNLGPRLICFTSITPSKSGIRRRPRRSFEELLRTSKI